LIIELYIKYMLGSMGTKGGIVLYPNGYGGYDIALGCPTVNGVWVVTNLSVD
jgi:hypothetical protein